MPIVALLGPQRLLPTLREAAEAIGGPERIAVITGGWEEREPEDDELARHFDGRTVNLRLHERLESVFVKDAELLRAVHRRRDRLLERRNLYRIRLAHALDAARELLRLPGDHDDLEAAREEAIGTIRTIDDHHLERVRDMRREFMEEFDVGARPGIAHHRGELAGVLETCDAIALAGGHVGRLLEQLRLFDLEPAIRARPVIAWSGGAMVLGSRIVLFHDAPPQGPGNAEVHDAGLSRYDGVLPLPNARHRLRLNDRVRVALFARRFAPDACVAMNEGARVVINGNQLDETDACRWLRADGSVVQSAAANEAPA